MTATANILSCGPPQAAERVQQVIDERKKANKRIDSLEGELSGTIALRLFDKARAKPRLFQYQHRPDDSTDPLGFLSLVATKFLHFYEKPAFKTKASYYAIGLTSSPSVQTATTVTTIFIFGSDEAQVKIYGEAVKAQLGVKGGGKGNKWSGKFIGVWSIDKEGAALEKILRDTPENRVDEMLRERLELPWH